MVVFSICQFFGRYFGNLNKNGLYLVFHLPNGDGKIQFLIENTTGMVFSICQYFGRWYGNLNKYGRYSVFESPNGDGKMQFLIENPTVTVFLQKFDYGITVIIEKINGNTVI